jgi:acetylornithine aminotransferase
MLGIELDRDCGQLVMQALNAGLLINVTAGNVIRLLPPLTLTHEQADEISQILIPMITAFIESS